MPESIQHFHDFRHRMNQRILETGNLDTKRFFGLDERVYAAGLLSAETKELLGLVASTVLRCDDCIRYHLLRCHQRGSPRDSLMEALNIALVVGGSIVIPHLRRAVEWIDELEAENQAPKPAG